MKELTVRELSNLKQNLEKDLLMFINQKVREFERATNVTVKNINIHRIESTSVGSIRRQSQITDVTIYLELGE